MNKNIKNALFGGIASGILISIGGSVYLSCENRYVGAVLFSVALICICYKSYYLYTGKVGYLLDNYKPKDLAVLFTGLLGNAVGTVLFGTILRFAIPSLGDAAQVICLAKLNNTFWQWLVKGTMCGVLMYLAVSIYAGHNKNVVGIIFCIPTFILCGFEHSVADIFYFSAGGIYEWKGLAFILTIILGNSIGAVILPALKKLAVGKNEKS